ncbi:MAG: DUF222 domain-containing protein [Acidimicrobiales bacterium]
MHPGRRRARALAEICRRAMAAGPHISTPAAPVVVVTVDLDTLEGRAGRDAAVAGHGHLTPGEARRLACDAHITRLITGRTARSSTSDGPPGYRTPPNGAPSAPATRAAPSPAGRPHRAGATSTTSASG